MTKFAKSAGLVIAGIIVGLLFSAASTASLGGVYSQVVNEFRDGLKAGTTNQLVVNSSGAITTSGDVTLSDDLILNQAGFCIDVYATSTATRGNFYASTTATIEGVDGVMMFRYGSCQ